jgi:hypothetical protein
MLSQPAIANGPLCTPCPALPARQVLWAHNSHVGDARATDASWRRGQLNVGQLAREAYGEGAVCIVGFTTHRGGRCDQSVRARKDCAFEQRALTAPQRTTLEAGCVGWPGTPLNTRPSCRQFAPMRCPPTLPPGHVSAADDWGDPVRRMAVLPALPGSYEAVLSAAAPPGANAFALDLRERSVADALEARRREWGPLCAALWGTSCLHRCAGCVRGCLCGAVMRRNTLHIHLSPSCRPRLPPGPHAAARHRRRLPPRHRAPVPLLQRARALASSPRGGRGG